MLDVLVGAGHENAQMVPSQAEYRFAPPPGRQSIPNLVKIALTAGFTPEEAAIAAAISMAESSGNPGAYNPDASTCDKSYGLWQINMLGGMGQSAARSSTSAETKSCGIQLLMQWQPARFICNKAGELGASLAHIKEGQLLISNIYPKRARHCRLC